MDVFYIFNILKVVNVLSGDNVDTWVLHGINRD
jgi:hypothetical protein